MSSLTTASVGGGQVFSSYLSAPASASLCRSHLFPIPSSIHLSATAPPDSPVAPSIQLIELTSPLPPSLSPSAPSILACLASVSLTKWNDRRRKEGNGSGGSSISAVKTDPPSPPPSPLVSLFLFCLNSSRDKHHITSNLLQNRMGRRGERERRGGEETRREGEKEVSFQVAGKMITGGEMTAAFNRARAPPSVSSSRPSPLIFWAPQNNLLLDSALEFQRLHCCNGGGEGQGCISVLNELHPPTGLPSHAVCSLAAF